MAAFLWMFFGGFTGGALGGLLGIGGGILIMPLLRFVIGLESAQAIGTCMVAVFFTTLGGSLRHFSLGHIHLRSLAPIIVAGVISTLIFSIFFLYMSDKSFWLDAAMGTVFLLVALRMLWEGASEFLGKAPAPQSDGDIHGAMTLKVLIGIAAGVLPGVLGIGTGAVLVPSFAFALGAPIKVAVGSSLACFSLNAFISSTFKLIQGFTQVEVLLPLCFGTLIGSRFGASLNGRFSSPFLKLAFGVFFGSVAYNYLKIFGL